MVEIGVFRHNDALVGLSVGPHLLIVGALQAHVADMNGAGIEVRKLVHEAM
jgi:hypothetical protein